MRPRPTCRGFCGAGELCDLFKECIGLVGDVVVLPEAM